MNLKINEIFYSLQGEGARSGEASIFIRLSGCNLRCDFCDTEFDLGQQMTLEQIAHQIDQYPCKWIIWTGGEPTLQITDQHLAYFKAKGYKQAIETNGTRPIPSLIDYISCSPKVAYEKVKTIIPFAHELRFPLKEGDVLPNIAILPKANNYFISPIFDELDANKNNINYCVDLIKNNPAWKLSVQMHKLINIE